MRRVLLLVLFAGCGFGIQGTPLSFSGSTSPASTAPTGIPQGVQLKSIVIETDNLSLSTPGFGQQLQATGICSDGHVRDLTHFVTWSIQDTQVASVDPSGIAHAVGAGTTTITASELGFSAKATLDVAASAIGTGTTTTAPPAAASGPSWHTDVFPLFQSKLACVTCHSPGGIGTATGIMVLTGVEATDYTTFTTKGLIDTGSPSQSLCVQKATGQVAHGGGAVISPTSPEAKTILAWIAAGAPLDGAPAAPTSLPTTPLPVPDALIINPATRNLVDPSPEQQIVVLAWYSATGSVVDVTQVSSYTFSVQGVATIDSTGLVQGTGQGALTLTAGFEGMTASADLAFDPKGALANGDAAAAIQLPARGTTLSGTGPKLTIVSGDGQAMTPGTLLAQPLVVAVVDAAGKPVPNVPVTFAVASGGGSITTTETVTNGSGQAQTTLVLGSATGPNTVTATASGAVANSPATFHETAQPPTLKVVAGNNQTGTTNLALAAPLVVALVDAAGNPLANQNVSFSITSAGGGSLSMVAVVTTANGQASTTLTLPGTPGPTIVTADVTGVSSATFSASAVAPTIAIVTGDAQRGVGGSVLAPLVVSLLDGNKKPFEKQAVNFTITQGNGTLSAASAVTDATGHAQVTLTLPTTPSVVAVTASYPGATASPLTFSETATVGPPTSIASVSGTPQTAQVLTTLQPFVAIVADTNGNPLQGQTVAFTINSGSGTLSAASAVTGANGQAQSTLTLPATAGLTTVYAAVAGVPSAAVFNATATAILPPTITVISGNNQAGLTGSKLGAPLVVLLKDGTGAILANSVVGFATSAGTLSASSVSTDATGQASVTLTLGAPGPATVTATYTGASAATFTETSNALPTIAIVSGNNQAAMVSTALPQPLVVLVKDGAGNPLPNAPVTFAVTAGGGALSVTTTTTGANGQAQSVLTLGPAAGANTVTATTPNAAAGVTFTATGQVLSWANDIYPTLGVAPNFCSRCHTAAGPGRMILTGNAASDYTTTVKNATAPLLVDTSNPANSYMLQKATGLVAHGGGQRFAVGSAQYNQILTWIQQGANP
jgi:adhesin/invasin